MKLVLISVDLSVSSELARCLSESCLRHDCFQADHFNLFLRDDEFILDYPIDASSSFVLQVDLSRIVGKVLEFFYLSRINDVRSGPKEPSREVQFLEEVSYRLL